MIRSLIFLAVSILMLSCNNTKTSEPISDYKTESLIVERVADHVFQHISFLQTESFGKVSCNGMIVFDHGEAIVFDTPADNATSLELIDWIENSLHCKVKAIVPTHFHADCLGGLDVFHKRGVASVANKLTIRLAESRNSILPKIGFDSLRVLPVGNKEVLIAFFGEGHTRDNVVGYFPDEKILFGGCLIKEVGASNGYLEDANVGEWSRTVVRLKEKYPDTKIVIPGHGKSGGTELLDFTIKLFEQQQ